MLPYVNKRGYKTSFLFFIPVLLKMKIFDRLRYTGCRTRFTRSRCRGALSTASSRRRDPKHIVRLFNRHRLRFTLLLSNSCSSGAFSVRRLSHLKKQKTKTCQNNEIEIPNSLCFRKQALQNRHCDRQPEWGIYRQLLLQRVTHWKANRHLILQLSDEGHACTGHLNNLFYCCCCCRRI